MTRITSIVIFALTLPGSLFSQRQVEYLDRGLIAVLREDRKVFLSWRLLADDPEDIAFNIYRYGGKGEAAKVNAGPISLGTNFLDGTADPAKDNYWIVKTVTGGKEVEESKPAKIDAGAIPRQYFSVPLDKPPGGEVMGERYTYAANDASVGDLDGDGEYEIILKWDPSNAKRPPQTGFTGEVIIDAYKLNGTRLWRIDLGKNVRAGAAYTQFLVYDFDGDGRSEMICKTADGSVDGQGHVIGDATKDWRTLDKQDPTFGKIVNGPEYLTVFEGLTGRALASAEYIPTRYPLDGWGGVGGNGNNDNIGSRADRFSACVAYLDGKHPGAVMVRGWYGRSVLAAWNWEKGKLRNQWVFDSSLPEWQGYSGMGNHNLSVADFDGDGRDEICIGAMTVDDNGKGLYTTGLRHGDALHAGDLDPERRGLEVFGIHENEGKTVAWKTPGVAMFDGRTGEILFSLAPGIDVGRGVAADIDPRFRGSENWGGPGGLRDAKGHTISDRSPASTNFVTWWDDDLTRELLDKNHIDKWDWEKGTTERLLTAEGCASNNGTKATPCLSADLFGDWREEVIWRTEDNSELRIYTTAIPTPHRFVTLMHDPQYRLSIAWQNVAYNQPPHTGFSLMEKGKGADRPEVRIIKEHVVKSLGTE